MPHETDVVVGKKPGYVYSPADWYTSGYTISVNSTTQRENSVQTRGQAQYLTNETDNKTFWDERNNRTRIDEKNIELGNWREALTKLIGQIDKDIDELSLAKNKTEAAVAAKNVALDVAIENLTSLDGRVQVDNVRDDVFDELNNEVAVIQGTKMNLQTKVQQAFEQLCLLKEARQNLQRDLEDKTVTLGIGVHNSGLTVHSPGISFKPDATRIPKGANTAAESEQLSLYNKQRGQAELAASQRLRESIQAGLMQAENDIDAQKNATEYAFRRRIHETSRAKDELEWQQKQTMSEIQTMEKQIRDLEAAIRAKKNVLKVAQTRLENRTDNPNVELVVDNIYYGLVDEVKQLEASVNALQAKTADAKHQLNSLQSELATINSDLTTKHNALTILEGAMDGRARLNATPKTATEINLTVTGIEKDEFNFLAQNARLNPKPLST